MIEFALHALSSVLGIALAFSIAQNLVTRLILKNKEMINETADIIEKNKWWDLYRKLLSSYATTIDYVFFSSNRSSENNNFLLPRRALSRLLIIALFYSLLFLLLQWSITGGTPRLSYVPLFTYSGQLSTGATARRLLLVIFPLLSAIALFFLAGRSKNVTDPKAIILVCSGVLVSTASLSLLISFSMSVTLATLALSATALASLAFRLRPEKSMLIVALSVLMLTIVWTETNLEYRALNWWFLNSGDWEAYVSFGKDFTILWREEVFGFGPRTHLVPTDLNKVLTALLRNGPVILVFFLTIVLSSLAAKKTTWGTILLMLLAVLSIQAFFCLTSSCMQSTRPFFGLAYLVILMPLTNAVFDWISISATRFYVNKGSLSDERALKWAMGDVSVALILFFSFAAIFFSLSYAFEFILSIALEKPIGPEVPFIEWVWGFFQGSNKWILLSRITIFVPTILYFALLITCLSFSIIRHADPDGHIVEALRRNADNPKAMFFIEWAFIVALTVLLSFLFLLLYALANTIL
jgi:hypothetical protein